QFAVWGSSRINRSTWRRCEFAQERAVGHPHLLCRLSNACYSHVEWLRENGAGLNPTNGRNATETRKFNLFKTRLAYVLNISRMLLCQTLLERTPMRQILLLVTVAVLTRPNAVCSQAPSDPAAGAAAKNSSPTIVLDLVRQAQAKAAAKDWKEAAALWE